MSKKLSAGQGSSAREIMQAASKKFDKTSDAKKIDLMVQAKVLTKKQGEKAKQNLKGSK